MVSMRLAAFIMSFAALSCACDRSPMRPSTTEVPSSPRMLASIHVVGPTFVTTGETARFTATARYSDGSSEDVTRTVHWSPALNSQTSLYFTEPGLALGIRAGESVVRAFFPTGPIMGTLVIGVLDAGTFALTGVVTESGAGALQGVIVDVVSGVGQGLQARTGANGHYAFYGVAGRVRVRASVDGFAPELQDLEVTRHGVSNDFTLAPVETTSDVSGIWTMTVTPARGCRAGLPEIALGRPYQMDVIQHGTRLRMNISGPNLTVHNPQGHVGTVLGSRVRLIFTGDTYYGAWSSPDIYDRLSPTEQFGFNGFTDGPVTGSSIRAALDGDLVYFNSETHKFEPAWYCRAKDHVVTLRRGT